MVSSNLVFVECLLLREGLQSRLDFMMFVANERKMGFTNFVVVLAEWNISETTAIIEKAVRKEMRSCCEVDHNNVGTKNANARDGLRLI